MLNSRSFLLALILGAIAVAAQAQVKAQVYTCTTATGRKITADRPIPECMDREQRELQTSTGRVNIVKPKQTEAERWAEREAQKQAERDREAALQQQRRDQQLLARYPDEAALEEAIADFGQRQRRFGKTPDQVQAVPATDQAA